MDKSVDMCIKDKSLTHVKFKDLLLSILIIRLIIWFFVQRHVCIMSVFNLIFITFHVKLLETLFMKHLHKHTVFDSLSFMFNKNFRKEPTEKQKLGQIGEDEACNYLKKEGYKIIERNYLRKWGEIDIIAEKAKKLHFVEVKSVSRVIISGVNHETPDGYRPEDNMHPWKLQRLSRVIQSYLLNKDISDDIEWQLDLITVYIDTVKGLHKVELLEDIVL